MSIQDTWRMGPVERRLTTEQVRREIRAAILAGRIAPRERLPEALLAQTFRTGRGAVREALRQLIQEGLVKHEINRGAHVRPVALKDVSDIYLARTVLEVAAVKHALAGNTTLDLSGLHAAQARIRVAAPPDAAPVTPSCELIAADLDFHRAMVALADSPRLSRAHEALAAESQMMLNWHPLYPTEKHWAYHQQILDAIESRDPRVLDAIRDQLRLDARLIATQSRRI